MGLLENPNARLESHTTLEVLIDNGDILRNYYFASSKLFFRGVTWEPALKQASEVKSSLTRSSDRCTVELFNADTELGKEFLSLGSAIDGAETVMGRHWIDLDSGMHFHDVLLTGALVAPPVDEDVVAVSTVSQPYANISVGASRRVSRSCQFNFRQPDTCGYAGSLLTCDFTLNGTGGCLGRHGDPLHRAKNGSFVFISGKSRLVVP